MAYVTWNALQSTIKPPSDPLYLDAKLWYCTEAEENSSTPYYPEDLIRMTNQIGFYYMSKRMGKFWDESKPVWVGYDSSDNVLTDVIILACPPYYPPHSTQGVDISNQSKPSTFP